MLKMLINETRSIYREEPEDVNSENRVITISNFPNFTWLFVTSKQHTFKTSNLLNRVIFQTNVFELQNMIKNS